MIKMNYRLIANFVAAAGFTLIITNWFLNKHILINHFPAMGGDFGHSVNCKRDYESLIIAIHAYPYLYTESDFGLREAVSTIREDDCIGKKFSSDSLVKLKSLYEDMEDLARKGKPSNLIYYNRELGSSRQKSQIHYPQHAIGKIITLFSAYSKHYSGNGFIHFLRCDYSLNYEPYHTFILSNMHRNTLHGTREARIIECGLEQDFQSEIDALLKSKIGTMKIIQE